MQQALLPVATHCTSPELDAHLMGLLRQEFAQPDLTPRQATEAAARKAAAAAVDRRWGGELVDFVVIRTVDLGSRLCTRV